MGKRERDKSSEEEEGLTSMDEFPDGFDGPEVDYDPRYVALSEPTSELLRVIDAAFRLTSVCIAPGAALPSELAARPADEDLPYLLQVRRVVNDVGAGLEDMIPPYVDVVYAALQMAAGHGPDVVTLRLGALYDNGYEVVVGRHGDEIRASVRPINTGTKAPLGLDQMAHQGFTPLEIVRSQLAHLATPPAELLALQRRGGNH